LGTDAGSNYERYKNPAVDALFDQYATASDAEMAERIARHVRAGAGGLYGLYERPPREGERRESLNIRRLEGQC